MWYDVLFFVAVFVLAVAGNMVGALLIRLVDRIRTCDGRLTLRYGPKIKLPPGMQYDKGMNGPQTEQDQMGC